MMSCCIPVLLFPLACTVYVRLPTVQPLWREQQNRGARSNTRFLLEAEGNAMEAAEAGTADLRPRTRNRRGCWERRGRRAAAEEAAAAKAAGWAAAWGSAAPEEAGAGAWGWEARGEVAWAGVAGEG